MNDLNYPKVRKLNRETANDLGLEKSFIDFIFLKEKPLCFEFQIEDPDNGWTCCVPDDIDVVYPLWSCNADQTLLCVSNNQFWFSSGYHDNAEFNYIAKTVQGLLADLFLFLLSSECSEVALKEGAQACGFRFLEELLQYSESEDYFENSDSEFVAKIDQLAIQPLSSDDLQRIQDFLKIDENEVKRRTIPDKVVQEFQHRGLIVTPPLPISDHNFPCGIRIIKPVSVTGNTLPFEERIFNKINTDAPICVLFWQDDKWCVELNLQMSSNPVNIIFESPQEAANNILDLYFGNPERMNQLNRSPYKSQKELHDHALATAKEILNNQIHLAEGVNLLAKISTYPGKLKSLLNPFYGWSHDFSKFPVGDTRKYWNKETLEKIDKEREMVEAKFKFRVTEACKLLVSKFS